MHFKQYLAPCSFVSQPKNSTQNSKVILQMGKSPPALENQLVW